MIQLSNEIRDELAQLFRVRPTDLEYLAGGREEINGLYQWCRNEKVKVKWLELQNEIQSWEKNRHTYGFIHNDNHQYNTLVRNNEPTLIDFDTAECHFFLQDLLIPIQGMIFDEVGGFDRPLTDEQAVKRFYESFLKGYETEYHVEDLWLDQLETLLNYRRVLLYTVMQDWMESDEKVADGFMRMIENPCSFSVV